MNILWTCPNLHDGSRLESMGCSTTRRTSTNDTQSPWRVTPSNPMDVKLSKLKLLALGSWLTNRTLSFSLRLALALAPSEDCSPFCPPHFCEDLFAELEYPRLGMDFRPHSPRTIGTCRLDLHGLAKLGIPVNHKAGVWILLRYPAELQHRQRPKSENSTLEVHQGLPSASKARGIGRDLSSRAKLILERWWNKINAISMISMLLFRTYTKKQIKAHK